MDNFKIYLKLIRMAIRSQMEYKASFIMMTIGHFVITFIEFMGLYALFLRFESINGWTLYEAAVFYGVINSSFAIAEGVGRGYDVFHINIIKGTFDRILLRPTVTTIQVLGAEFQLMRIGRLLQGFLALIWGLSRVEVRMTIIQYIIIVLTIIGGVAMFIGLMVLQATLSFWSVQSLEIVNSFTYGGVQTAQYPMDIYKKWFQRIFIFVIPIGCVSYLPLNAVLRDGNIILGILAPFVGIVFYFVAQQFFKVGIRYYCSTGS